MIQIQTVRKELALSQSEMAVLLETSVKTLQGWEQGRPMPKRVQKSLRVILWFYEQGELAVYRKI